MLCGAIGVGLSSLFGGGAVAASVDWSVFCAAWMVGFMELYASTHALVLGEHGLTIVGPVAVRGPKTDVEIPYAALVNVEEHGSKLKLGYHVDPLMLGDPPTHHVTIEPEEKEALLHALTRMQRAQRHHTIARARNRYRLALTTLATLGVAAGGGTLLAVIRR